MTYTKPRTITGRVVHLRDLEGGGTEEWGRERFAMSVFEHGRLMNATMEFDDHKVLRNANWTVDADWTPIEASSREIVDGEWVASCWFRAAGSAVECEAFTRQNGRISQRLEAGRRIDYFGMHTILADVLVAAACGLGAPGVEKSITCVTNSVGNWGMGNYQAYCVTPLVTYVGPDEVEVIAGTFACEHFRVRWSDLTPHYSDFWVTREDFLPLKLTSAFGPVRYELAGLDG